MWNGPMRCAFSAGARGMLLLNDVPLGYEVWRQLNGFPPQFPHAQQGRSERKQLV